MIINTNDCNSDTALLREQSSTNAQQKDKRNFLFGGFIASYESLCINEQLCFVSTVVRKLPQIKNFVYPLCVVRKPKERKIKKQILQI